MSEVLGPRPCKMPWIQEATILRAVTLRVIPATAPTGLTGVRRSHAAMMRLLEINLLMRVSRATQALLSFDGGSLEQRGRQLFLDGHRARPETNSVRCGGSAFASIPGRALVERELLPLLRLATLMQSLVLPESR